MTPTQYHQSRQALPTLIPSPAIARLIERRCREFRVRGYPPQSARREAVGCVEREIGALRQMWMEAKATKYQAVRERLLAEARGQRAA